MNKTIEKDFNKKLTKKDYLLYLINRNAFILVSPLIILALIVVFIYMVNKDGFQTNDFLYLMPILLFLLSYIQIHKAINNAFKTNNASGNLKVKFEIEKYSEETSNGTNSLAYNKFNSYYESKNYYYLYIDKVNAIIIPKREFSSDELSTINKRFQKNIKKINLLNFSTILSLIFSIFLIACMVILLISII